MIILLVGLHNREYVCEEKETIDIDYIIITNIIETCITYILIFVIKSKPVAGYPSIIIRSKAVKLLAITFLSKIFLSGGQVDDSGCSLRTFKTHNLAQIWSTFAIYQSLNQLTNCTLNTKWQR